VGVDIVNIQLTLLLGFFRQSLCKKSGDYKDSPV